MVTFRVTAERLCAMPPGQREPNPFFIRDLTTIPPRRVICRTWEFQARSEKQVRELFGEAQRMGVENVRGFRLTNIERVAYAAL